MSRYVIQISAGEQARCNAALGRELNLTDKKGDPRDATDSEVAEVLGNHLVRIVARQETKTAQENAAKAIRLITPEYP